MSDDAKKPDDQLPQPKKDATQLPVKRKSLSSDPTMPIKLDRSMWKKPPTIAQSAPTEAVPTIPDPEKEAADAAAAKAAARPAESSGGKPDEWIGKEATLIGGAAPQAGTSKLKIASMDEDEGWLGTEQTLVGGSAPNAKATEADAAGWTGSEATVVGMPAPKLTSPGGQQDEEWVGREATLLGMDAKGALSIETPADKKHKSRTGSDTRGTSPTLDDGWHLKGRQGPLTGKALGDYEIGGILGEGGMGTVYRARQISLKRRVALKVLPPNLAHDVNLRSRFESEARTASLLNTPHVVQVFAAGTQDDIVYFVMEYVEGTDLSAIINEKKDKGEKFTCEEAAGYILQSARGLAEAGKHNIVHRDIKPPNLMVTAKGVVKIADFGISKVTGEHGLTMTGTAVGTPAYCSPEQGRGDMVDCRADIYSLGVVFFELLAGQKPFDGTTANALIYQHNYAEPPLPTSINPEVTEAYQAVVMKCLQKDPAKRYQDASELVTDLERIRDGSMSLTAVFSAKFGTGAEEAMSRYLGVKKRRTWPLVAAGILALGGAGAGYYVYNERSEQRRLEATELQVLRGLLKPLDLAAPVPGSAAADLEKLTKIKGPNDADVKRYAAKLGVVRKLQERLGRLDSAQVVPATLRLESEKDLDAYIDQVGKTGTDIARWKDKLEGARADALELRKTLSDIDSAPAVTVALRDRLDPPLARLKVLAGDADPDVSRWSQRFAEFADRLAKLRSGLAALDAKDAMITETQAARFAVDLEALRQAVGGADADADRWSDRLGAAQERIARLRKSLARLDGGEYVQTALHQALKGDLDDYQALVDAGDPDLKRWLERVRASVDYVKQLRDSLAPLDKADLIRVSERAGYQASLDRLRAIAGEDDAQVRTWARKLGAARDHVAELRATLARLDKENALKVEEQDACGKALTELDSLGGLTAEEKRFYARRLAEERARLKELRDDLAAKAAANQNVSDALIQEVEQLAALVGEQDPDVKAWRVRVADYQRLKALLSPLDSPAPIPTRAEELLGDFAKIVGGNDDKVVAWRAKVAQVARLRQQLAPLDQVVPLPSGAADDVAELARQVGSEEPDVKRWKVKVERVASLRGVLGAELRDAYILPSHAPAQCAELISLIGPSEEDVRRWAVRVAVLQGPQQPSWASGYGRDQYGPWAELTIKGQTQRFRYVPSGTFTMGTPDSERGREKDEPRVRVTLTQSYWMADSECTQGFWEAVGLKHDSRFRGADKPVERVSWEDCQVFLRALNTQVAKLNAKLPTEAQWEYACRGGSDAAFSSYQGAIGEQQLETIGWFAKNAGGGTKGVKRRFPNNLGLHDMHGNVWEWCEDRYGNYSPNPVEDWVGHEEETRVVRGGSWGDQPRSLRSGNRLAVRADMRTVYIGFRLSAPVEWPQGKAPGQGPIAVAETEHPYTPITGEEPEPVASVVAAKVADDPRPVASAQRAEVEPGEPQPVAAPIAAEAAQKPIEAQAAPVVPAKAEPSPAAARFAAIVVADATLAAACTEVELVQQDGVATLRGRAVDAAARNRLGLAAMRAVGDRVVNRLEVGPAPAAAAPAEAAKPEPAWKQAFAKSVAADAALAGSAKTVELVEVGGVPTLRGTVPSAALRSKVAMLALRAVRGHVDVQVEVKPAAPAP